MPAGAGLPGRSTSIQAPSPYALATRWLDQGKMPPSLPKNMVPGCRLIWTSSLPTGEGNGKLVFCCQLAEQQQAGGIVIFVFQPRRAGDIVLTGQQVLYRHHPGRHRIVCCFASLHVDPGRGRRSTTPELCNALQCSIGTEVGPGEIQRDAHRVETEAWRKVGRGLSEAI